jgi:hypothetical protein
MLQCLWESKVFSGIRQDYAIRMPFYMKFPREAVVVLSEVG